MGQIYCRVALKNWQAFANAKISSVQPRGNSLFWDSTSLQAGQRFGSTYGPTPNTPDKPALISLTCTPGSLRARSQLESYEEGRKPYKKVAIANSDSGAFAYTHSAINEAYRAVQDL